MQRVMLKSKIHRATVTDCDLHYVGSITIDPDLLEAADILEHEQVHVLDIDNGARFETYTIAGERGSGACRSMAPPPAWCTAATRSSSSPTANTTNASWSATSLASCTSRRNTNRIITVDDEVATLLAVKRPPASTRSERKSAMSSHATSTSSASPADPGRLPMTLPLLAEKKRLGEPIVMVTAYDYPSARAAEAAGVDLVLVGDSAATTVLGYSSTTPVELDDMLVLARAVRRGLQHAAVDRRPAVRLL